MLPRVNAIPYIVARTDACTSHVHINPSYFIRSIKLVTFEQTSSVNMLLTKNTVHSKNAEERAAGHSIPTTMCQRGAASRCGHASIPTSPHPLDTMVKQKMIT